MTYPRLEGIYLQGLQQMLNAQRDLQENTYGHQLDQMTPDERADFIRTNVVACSDELHEAMRETGWKPWSTKRHFNTGDYMEELIDAFHFFMNLWLLAGGTAEDLYLMYLSKRNENIKRQQEGY